MSDEEIMKALECCASTSNVCDECPMPNNIKDDCRCGEHLANYALDIINRQQTEIEQLKFEIAKLLPKDCSYAIQVEVSNKLEARIKSEAIKEFADRLKNKIKIECNPYGKPTFDYETSLAIMRYMDNIVEEMVGEKNE